MKKRFVETVLALSLGVFSTLPLSPLRAEEAPRVAVSILPLHGLVQSVMEGVGEAELLMDSGASPHGYALRPSQIRNLNDADLVVWVGEGLESFLRKPLAAKGEGAVMEVMELEGLALYENRRGGVWREAEGHGHDNHDGHDEHGDEHHEEGHHDDHAEEAHTHDHGRFDPHLWLSPDNARLIVRQVGAKLSELDPAHAESYEANVSQTLARLNRLEGEIETQLASVRTKPYLVFHDAYQYFERAFDLHPVGAVTINPERKPGVKRLRALQAEISESGAVCIFREPQFRPAIISTLAGGAAVKVGELDPLGADIAQGAGAYEALMRRLADGLAGCLSG